MMATKVSAAVERIYGVLDKTARRFWTKVVPATPDECWVWRGGCTQGGYAAFRFDSDGTAQNKSGYGHRYSWFFHYGPIPEDTMVVHKRGCSKRCVNPRHLRLQRARYKKGSYSNVKKLSPLAIYGRSGLRHANRRIAESQKRQLAHLACSLKRASS